MSKQKVAPYGSWKSPITADSIIAANIGLGQIAVDEDDLYWLEVRPNEAGRNVIVKWSAANPVDQTPAPFNVRTRVHEYGGGGYLVKDGTIYFSNFADQRLYKQAPGLEPKPLTPAAAVRFADGIFAGEHYICVREDHRQAGQEAVNSIVTLELDGLDTGTILVSGNDFYASPRISPDGKKLAWLTWKHPNMPWDGTELWVATLTAAGQLQDHKLVAGGPQESIFQPEWSPDGVLHFISDRTDWWNLYRWRDGAVEALYPMAAEFGLPQWVFGMRAYAFLSAHEIICSVGQHGCVGLACLDTSNGRFTPLDLPFTNIRDVNVIGDDVFFFGASPTQPKAIVCLNLTTDNTKILRKSSDMQLDPGYVSLPKAIEFPTENGLNAHAFYYPPHNQDFCGPEDERPPLLVKSHGGPTGAVFATLDPDIQYWTSRGFGVLDVNYGGSVGYGRAYRQRLNGQWGIVDIDDCKNGALYLVEQDMVDGDRLAIRGHSAGGYTTLGTLAFRDTFSAGASHFGVSDLEALAKETHKFESRYPDNLIGPYPARRDLYVARSPINFVEQFNSALILFQGLEDRVVPPNQAEMIYNAVKAKGLPVAYLAYEGEQHGFRRAENIKRTFEAELYFYSKVFNFVTADTIEPVEIANLK